MRRLFLMLPDRTPSWVMLPVLDRDYRALVLWTYRLMVKVRTMAWIVGLLAPFATPGLAALLNRRSASLSVEVQALKRSIRDRRRLSARTVPVINPWAR